MEQKPNIRIRVIEKPTRTLFKVNDDLVVTESDLDLWRGTVSPRTVPSGQWTSSTLPAHQERNIEIWLRYNYACINALFSRLVAPATLRELGADYQLHTSRISRIVDKVSREGTWKAER